MAGFCDQGVPAYVALAEYLWAAIDAGEYGPDEQLPSAADLLRLHDVSIEGARHALRSLTRELWAGGRVAEVVERVLPADRWELRYPAPGASS